MHPFLHEAAWNPVCRNRGPTGRLSPASKRFFNCIKNERQSARGGSAAFQGVFAVIIYLFLGFAVHHKRNGPGEVILQAGLHGHECLPLHFENACQVSSAGHRARIVVAGKPESFRVLEDRGVIIDSFFGVSIEPLAWGDFFHYTIFLSRRYEQTGDELSIPGIS